MKPLTRCSWSALFSAPYATSGSSGWPVLVSLARSVIASTKSSWIRGPASTRVAAVQSWPALKYPASAIACAAFSRSASSKTTTGALPPSSRWVRLSCRAAADATSIPARTDPVIATSCGISWSTSARPVSRSPQTTLNTPGGRNSLHSSASSTVDAGVVSLGLSTTVLPGGEGGCDLPDRHHQRVVPRRHLTDDADRLAPDPRRVAGQVLTRPTAPPAPGPRRRRTATGLRTAAPRRSR